MNAIFTAYFVGQEDSQRGLNWEADESKLQPLIESLDTPLFVFTDCFKAKNTKSLKYIYHRCDKSPYFERWFAYYDYLIKNPDIENVFCVDATDVVMVNNPFEYFNDKLYIGDEDQFLGTEWMINNHTELFLRDFLIANRKKRLLNGGLIGAKREILLSFLKSFIEYTNQYSNLGNTDMGLINYIAYTKFKGKVSNGQPINSQFKKYEDRDDVWFRHK